MFAHPEQKADMIADVERAHRDGMLETALELKLFKPDAAKLVAAELGSLNWGTDGFHTMTTREVEKAGPLLKLYEKVTGKTITQETNDSALEHRSMMDLC